MTSPSDTSVTFVTYRFLPCSEPQACAKLIEQRHGQEIARAFFLRHAGAFVEVPAVLFFAALTVTEPAGARLHS